jgi:hypothetical protein
MSQIYLNLDAFRHSLIYIHKSSASRNEEVQYSRQIPKTISWEPTVKDRPKPSQKTRCPPNLFKFKKLRKQHTAVASAKFPTLDKREKQWNLQASAHHLNRPYEHVLLSLNKAGLSKDQSTEVHTKVYHWARDNGG